MPFKKGQSGNPGGRPLGRSSLADRLRYYLEMTQGELNRLDTKRLISKDIFVLKTIQDAMKGDAQARRIIWDRVDGLPTQKLQHMGIEFPKKIEIVFGKGEEEDEGQDNT